MQAIPTGIDVFDRIVGGGLPAGSVTLCLGEVGAGHREFVHSSVLAAVDEQSLGLKRVAYVSFIRPREQLELELAALSLRFDVLDSPAFAFADMSPYWFRETIAPAEWIGDETFASVYMGGDLFKAVFDFVEKHGRGALVVFDSLTDVVRDREAFQNLLPFLRALQRFAAKHKSLVMCLQSGGVLEPRDEAALQEAADGTLVFSWFSGAHGLKRRHLWVKDFRGLTPILTEKNLSEFTAEISAGSGFGLTSLSRVG